MADWPDHECEGIGNQTGTDKKQKIHLCEPLNNGTIRSHSKIMQLLGVTVIECSGKEYMTWEEIVQHQALFPFQVHDLTQTDMALCEHLCLEQMADDIVIRLLGSVRK